MEILSLSDYINYAAWLVETGQYKRIDFVLKLCLTSTEFKEFKQLIRMFEYDLLYEKFDSRITFNIHPYSSNPKDAVISIDDKDYYLVGNEEQFMSQFKVELREQRLKDLLDEDDD